MANKKDFFVVRNLDTGVVCGVTEDRYKSLIKRDDFEDAAPAKAKSRTRTAKTKTTTGKAVKK